ncbi:MAG: hypothetical protein ACI396_06400 [Acutalibacteraceae bacterium]
MIQFRYTENEERQAQEKATEMVHSGLYNRFNGTVEERIAHAKTGCLGEIMFRKVLQNANVNYELDHTDFSSRNADEFDFKINNLKFDVKVAKTNGQPKSSWAYGYPCDQITMTKDFVVIGYINETNRLGGFYGWIPFSEIQNYDIATKNSFSGIPYNTENYEFRWGDLCRNFEDLFIALRTYYNKEQACRYAIMDIWQEMTTNEV